MERVGHHITDLKAAIARLRQMICRTGFESITLAVRLRAVLPGLNHTIPNVHDNPPAMTDNDVYGSKPQQRCFP